MKEKPFGEGRSYPSKTQNNKNLKSTARMNRELRTTTITRIKNNKN
jgi:hypothetical protein